MDINTRLFDLFQNEDLYKPVNFKSNNNKEITSNNIYILPTFTHFNKYYKLLKSCKS